MKPIMFLAFAALLPLVFSSVPELFTIHLSKPSIALDSSKLIAYVPVEFRSGSGGTVAIYKSTQFSNMMVLIGINGNQIYAQTTARNAHLLAKELRWLSQIGALSNIAEKDVAQMDALASGTSSGGTSGASGTASAGTSNASGSAMPSGTSSAPTVRSDPGAISYASSSSGTWAEHILGQEDTSGTWVATPVFPPQPIAAAAWEERAAEEGDSQMPPDSLSGGSTQITGGQEPSQEPTQGATQPPMPTDTQQPASPSPAPDSPSQQPSEQPSSQTGQQPQQPQIPAQGSSSGQYDAQQINLPGTQPALEKTSTSPSQAQQKAQQDNTLLPGQQSLPARPSFDLTQLLTPLLIATAVLMAIVVALLMRPRISDSAQMHRMLSSPTRLNILNELSQNDKIPTDLSNRIGKSKATVIEHLERLRETGFVEKVQQQGKKFVYYRITSKGKTALIRSAG